MEILQLGCGGVLPKTWVGCFSVAIKSFSFIIGHLAPRLILPLTDCANLGKLHRISQFLNSTHFVKMFH